MALVAIDVGFGDTKVAASVDEESISLLKFPSLVVRCLRKDEDAVRYGGSFFIVGERAERWLNDPKCIIPLQSGRTLVRHYPLFVHTALEKLGVEPEEVDALVVGLSTLHYDSQRSELADVLRAFSVNGKNYQFVEGENLIILIQGWGAVFERYPEGNHSGILVVDIGYYTTDVFLIHEGNKLNKDRSFGIPVGVNDLVAQVAILLEEEYNLKGISRDFLRTKIFSESELRIAGLEISLSEFTREAKKAVAEKIVSELLARTEDLIPLVEEVILIGGGIVVMKEELEALIQGIRYFVPSQPEYANVRGYLKRLLQWWKSEVSHE